MWKKLKEWLTSTTLLCMALGLCSWLSAETFGGKMPPFLKEIAHSGGITLLSVFSIKLIYEASLADHHNQIFTHALENILSHSAELSGSCLRLGVSEIFTSRDDFKAKYDLFSPAMLNFLKRGSAVNSTGGSLRWLLEDTDGLLKILKKGVTVHLCLMDPRIYDRRVCTFSLTQLNRGDIAIAIDSAERIRNQISRDKIHCSLEIRMHPVILFDSCTSFSKSGSHGGVLLAWDLNFGLRNDQRRIFLLQGGSALGANVSERYSRIWQLPETKALLKIQAGIIEEDNIKEIQTYLRTSATSALHHGHNVKQE
ncbi:MAG: hypothetical protein JST93_18510 [Acidobacteria bacterium]|nr:hypothetical protein [Acidobacteriota bacterium]